MTIIVQVTVHEITDNMSLEIKERIIERAALLFAENGIKTITMDDLANYLGMSKRTIYEYFSDKKELVNESLLYFETSKERKNKRIFDESENMFEALLQLYKENLQEIQKVNKRFIDDIQKYYPEINQRHIQQKEERIKETVAFFQKGINEGLIREELNLNILSVFVTNEMDLLFNGKSFLIKKFAFLDIYKALFLTFLRGIATDKGLKIIDNFTAKDQKKEE
jgi:AcrR family transcriptional regulator